MARMIGRTRSWVWWLGGLACALAFGATAKAQQAVIMYGIRPRPPRPPINEKAVTEAQKKKARELVAEYMADPQDARPSADERKKITGLIKDLGSDRFATREAASKALVGFGTKALPQLEETRKRSGDAEVVQRARKAVAEIRQGGRKKIAGELRKIRNAAHVVIREETSKHRTAAYKANLTAISLEKAGKKKEAEARRAEQQAATRKVAELTRLYSLVVYGAVAVPVRPPSPKYGIMIRRLKVQAPGK